MEIVNLTGQQFGQSELRELIAIGKLGAVYRGYHTGMQQTVAVKILLPQFTSDPALFEQTMKAAVALEHDHILPIYEYGIEQDLGYITMRLVTGSTLAVRRAQALDNKRKLPSLRETAIFFRQLASIVDDLHLRGILHLDIKPSNLIFDAAGTVYLTDFGLARLKEPTRSGEPAPADDVYALAATIATLLAHPLPFDVTDPAPTIGDHLAEFSALLQTEDADAAAILVPVFEKAFASDPAARYPTALECSQAFDAVRPLPSPSTRFFTVYTARPPVPNGIRALSAKPSAANAAQPPALEPADVSSVPDSGMVLKRVPVYKNPLYVFLALLTVGFMAGMLLTLPDRGDNSSKGKRSGPEPTVVPNPTIDAMLSSGVQNNSDWIPVEQAINNLPMVQVPEGCFMMGKSGSVKDFEVPVHRVCLTAFWIGQTEVTNAQYRGCVDAGVCDPPSDRTYFDDPEYDDYPVVFVDWDRANAFASWAGGSLPTDAQWEYAARGPDSWLYPWGNDHDGTRLNFCDTACKIDPRDTEFDDRFAMLAPVGSFAGGASWVGALDLAGNVWEWAADWYDLYSEHAQVDPTGPASGTERFLRGGSWANNVDAARTTYRMAAGPLTSQDRAGFRIVMPAGQDG